MRQRYDKSAFFAKKACNTVFFLFKGMSELKECVTCCCLEHMMAQCKRNHKPKFWSVIQRKQTEAKENYERVRVMMAHVQKKTGFKTRLHVKVFKQRVKSIAKLIVVCPIKQFVCGEVQNSPWIQVSPTTKTLALIRLLQSSV